MEISVPLNNVNPQYIYFAEKKKNVIVDGEFIKLIYSTSGFEMIGLYVLFEMRPLHRYTFKPPGSIINGEIRHNTSYRSFTDQEDGAMSQLLTKRTVTFDPYLEHNYRTIHKLCNIERDIIERYTAGKYRPKMASYILKTQLLYGSIKCHSECKDISTKKYKKDAMIDGSSSNIMERIVLKISGIWETDTNVGITMKFILLQD